MTVACGQSPRARALPSPPIFCYTKTRKTFYDKGVEGSNLYTTQHFVGNTSLSTKGWIHKLQRAINNRRGLKTSSKFVRRAISPNLNVLKCDFPTVELLEREKVHRIM